MTGLARFVLRHRLLVVVAWVAALVAGMAMSQKAIDRLTFDFSLPGQPGFETEQQLVKLYGNGPDEGTAVIAVSVPSGTVADRRQQVDGIFRGLQQQFPQYRIVWGGNTGNVGFTTDDQRTAYGIVDGARLTSFTAPPPHRAVKPYLEQQARATGLTVRTTGYFELAEGGGAEGSKPPSVLGETLLGAAGALVVLVFVFASFLALVPLLVAAVSILTTFLCLLGLTYLTDVSFIVQFLVALVGLGVAIDYSLLVVNRWREERERGLDNAEAVVEAVRTAGHAVVASAGTVAISLLPSSSCRCRFCAAWVSAECSSRWRAPRWFSPCSRRSWEA